MLDGVAVRLKTPTIDRDVSHLVSDLGFTTQAPGGHVQCSFRLNAGYDDFPDLGPMSRVWVTTTSGKNLWGAGYADTPGKNFDGTEGFDLTFKGGATTAEDGATSMLYLTREYEQWQRGNSIIAPSATTDISPRPDVADSSSGVLLTFPSGVAVDVNANAEMLFDLRGFPGQEVGGIAYSVVSGLSSLNWSRRVLLEGGLEFHAPISTTPDSAARFATVEGFAGARWAILRMRRIAGGATNIGLDNAWTHFSDVRVVGQHRDRWGTRVTHGQADFTLASRVVEDLLWRLLPEVDIATAEVVDTAYQIDQLAYFDGATAAQVLDDLAEFEPDMLWWIGESGVDTGHRFRFVPWPTTPRYELWSDDGVDFPGSESDLCDRVTVNWTDEKDRKQSRTVTLAEKVSAGTATADDFVALERLAGRQRSASAVTLPDGVGSAANAYAAGVAILNQANTVAQAGRVSIRRKVRDLITGNWLDPAELVSGEVARVADLGTTLRVTETDVSIDASGQENTLTLGTPVRSFVDLLSGQKVHRWALRT